MIVSRRRYIFRVIAVQFEIGILRFTQQGRLPKAAEDRRFSCNISNCANVNQNCHSQMIDGVVQLISRSYMKGWELRSLAPILVFGLERS